MTPERWQQAKQLFGAALERDAAERSAFVAAACAGDGELRAELERLLAGHCDSATFLERPAAAVADPPVHEPVIEVKPDAQRFGPFRILGILGEGGMGTVYLAEQDSPRRTVALKVIRSAAASENLLRRFEQEAAALARLQHPGIAQIYQAGAVSQDGRRRPYFAMELVRGVPLTRYAHEHALPVRSRIELVIRIADAVQHAHVKGVVHRDLKPANILVDEGGTPKILDFGVARLTDSDIRVTTIQTGIGQLVGTVPYMSPEQVSGDPHAADTRSDVYALGVILFELLTGRLPYDLENRSVPEALRLIQDSTPARLSSVVRTLRGDLDTIVAKALEKDKQRRYQCASDFAADLRRYLASEPILARPPSTLYHLRKFAARNRVLVGATALVFLALVGGIVGVTIQRNHALTAAAKANAISAFLTEMLESVDPDKTHGREVTVRDALDGAAARIAKAPFADPEVDATIRGTIGSMYWKISALDDAERMLQDAIEVGTRRLGPDHRITLAAMNDLALVYKDWGLIAKSAPLVLRVYEARRRSLGERHPETLSSMNNAARALGNEGKWDEAIPLMERTIDLRTSVLGADHRRTLCSIDNLGRLYFQKGDLDKAEPIYRDVIPRFVRALGENDPDTLVGVQNLAELLYRRGSESDLAEAESLALRAAEGRTAVYGPEVGYTVQSRNLLGQIIQARGRPDEAEPILREAAETAVRTLPEGNPKAAVWTLNHAECLALLGRDDEAETAFLGAHASLSRDPVANAAPLKSAAESLARFYESRNRPADAARFRP